MSKSFTRSVQTGFTLIELIVVIVILGILAATALPRFINVSSSARAASIKGLAGALNSAVVLTHSQSMLNGANSAATSAITMDGGTVVSMAYGYPASGTGTIDVAVAGASNPASYTEVTTATTTTFEVVDAATPASCSVVYTAATSSTVAATVGTATITGC